MKKLLTILLTVLMALTIGTINVLAEVKPEIQVKVTDVEDPIALGTFDLTKSYKDDYTAIYKLGGVELTSKEAIETKAIEMYNAKPIEGVELTCGEEEGHVHSLAGKCYEQTCTKPETHTHEIADGCYTRVTNHYQNPSKGWGGWTANGVLLDPQPTELVDDNKDAYELPSNPGNNTTVYAYVLTCEEPETHEHTIAGGCYKLICEKEENHTHDASCYTVTVPVVAEYTAIKYTVIFDADGGNFGGEPTVTKQTSADDKYLVEAPANPVRSGYEFVGYYYFDAQGDPQFIDNISTFEFKADTTVYASWYEKEVRYDYDVTYNLTNSDKVKLASIAKKNWTSWMFFNLEIGTVDTEVAIPEIEAKFVTGETIGVETAFDLTKEFYTTNKNGTNTKHITELDEEIHELDGSVEIELEFDAPELKSGYSRIIKVYSYHNSAYEIPVKSIDGNTVKFDASQFSTFVVTYRDVLNVGPAPKKKTTFVAPKTGVQ